MTKPKGSGGLLAAVQHSGSLGEGVRAAASDAPKPVRAEGSAGKGAPYPSTLLKPLIVRLPPVAHQQFMIQARKLNRTATSIMVEMLDEFFVRHGLPQLAKDAKDIEK